MLILILALMVFGPRRLPEIAGKLGKYIRDIRGMSQGLLLEWQREITVAARLEEIEAVRQELELTRQELQQAHQEIGSQTRQDIKEAKRNVEEAKKAVSAPVQPVVTSTKQDIETAKKNIKEAKETISTAAQQQTDSTTINKPPTSGTNSPKTKSSDASSPKISSQEALDTGSPKPDESGPSKAETDKTPAPPKVNIEVNSQVDGAETNNGRVITSSDGDSGSPSPASPQETPAAKEALNE